MVVGTTDTQTLTNKTLTSPVVNTPTGITKTDVGLGNVDNTSDATKNSATATLTNKTLTSPVINAPVLTGGTINNTPIGATTPSTGAFTTLTANFIQAENILTTGAFTWDSATSSPAAIAGGQSAPVVTSIHKQMRGCVLNSNGTVNYYLDETDWSKKTDGTASVLTGADGNVMVEIPKFWFQVVYITTKTTWRISPIPASGFQLHPAFIKDGVEVDFRYYGAYDASVFDVSTSTYLSGLNYDNNDGVNGVGVNVTATTGDKLASVKGVYPMVGLTRAEFRTIAANVGIGWRQLDFALWSAVQLLYLVEYQSFYSQEILGAGNTNGSYLASSGNQTDSPHTIAGAGDSIADGSTNTVTGAGVSAKPGTSFMKYRGIENLYGNAWNWADGINVNVTANGNVHVTNNRANFADNTSTNMTLITSSLPTASGYISDLLSLDGYLLSSSNSGGGSTTYITDYHYASTSSNSVVIVGGGVDSGATAGAFYLYSVFDSSAAIRLFGARLAY